MPSSSNDALALAEQAEAEAAEAEAAEAEALAAAASARALSAKRRSDALVAKRKVAEELRAAQDAEAKEEDAPEDALEDADESAEPEEGTRWYRRRPALSSVVTAVASVVLVAALTVCGLMLWRHHTVAAQDAREAAFIAAARQGIVNLTSLDFNNATSDVQRVIDSSAGEFRDDFESKSADFISVVEQSKVVTKGTINAVGIQSIDGDTATLLVSAKSEVSNVAGAQQDPRAFRLIVTMVDEDGQIKMAKVEFVP